MRTLQPITHFTFCNYTKYNAGAISAPRNSEMLNLWRDFLKVVKFIDKNQEWLITLLGDAKALKE